MAASSDSMQGCPRCGRVVHALCREHLQEGVSVRPPLERLGPDQEGSGRNRSIECSGLVEIPYPSLIVSDQYTETPAG